MTDIPFGTIVLTHFPFTDLSTTKRRPALVVSTENERRLDIVVAYITSVLTAIPDAAAIQPDSGNGLKRSSQVRFDKLATLNKDIITGRLGEADPAWLHQHATIFFNVFGFHTEA